MRSAQLSRGTAETKIMVGLDLDGKGTSVIKTGVGFLDHMLTLFARHGRFDLTVQCEGDIQVDGHHSVEDIGIVLGRAFGQALGDMAGINRYGNFLMPMDEALLMIALDLSGRAYLGYEVELPAQKVGDFDTELTEEFFLAFARSLQATIHIRMLAGRNTHHIIEGIFKGFGRALRQAVDIDPAAEGAIPSTKGTLLG